jgi:hypothetical protein
MSNKTLELLIKTKKTTNKCSPVCWCGPYTISITRVLFKLIVINKYIIPIKISLSRLARYSHVDKYN